jgi:hypothetical protein
MDRNHVHISSPLEPILGHLNIAHTDRCICLIYRKKLRGFGPLANYADRATAACWRSSANFADRGCRVGSATDPPVVSLGFLYRSRYYFFQVAPQLSSRGWVDTVPDPLLLRKSGRAGNLTRNLWICSQKLWPLDHRGGRLIYNFS